MAFQMRTLAVGLTRINQHGCPTYILSYAGLSIGHPVNCHLERMEPLSVLITGCCQNIGFLIGNFLENIGDIHVGNNWEIC